MKEESVAKKHGLVNPYYGVNTQNMDISKPSREQTLETIRKTGQVLGIKVSAKTEAAFCSSNALKKHSKDQFVKYTPKDNVPGRQAHIPHRLIKMTTEISDPLEPPKFKHKRIPLGAPPAPPPVMQSPPRKLTNEDQLNWKVPPCVSNWKNAKGYIIPLHIRIQADGRNMQDTTINPKFAKITEALYASERHARTEIEERNKIQQSLTMREALIKEEALRNRATKARAQKAELMASTISKMGSETPIEKNGKREKASFDLGKRKVKESELEEAKKERDALRHQRKREIERDRRIEVAGNKKAKLTRDLDRDVSEKIALGQAQPSSRDTMFDARLYNQTAGLDSGFGHDEDYQLYDKPLFGDRSKVSLHRNIREAANEVYNSTVNPDVKKVLNRPPARAFEGAQPDQFEKQPRNKPVEFEQKHDPLFDNVKKR